MALGTVGIVPAIRVGAAVIAPKMHVPLAVIMALGIAVANLVPAIQAGVVAIVL